MATSSHAPALERGQTSFVSLRSIIGAIFVRAARLIIQTTLGLGGRRTLLAFPVTLHQIIHLVSSLFGFCSIYRKYALKRMSDFTKCTWERESESAGAMESCYRLYTWINHTLLMLLFQIIWKFSQISDYIKGKSIQEPKNETTVSFSPLSKETKYRRHIRSMSDVQSSTPCRLPHRARKGSNYILMYDSDTRARRILSRHRQFDSSDSSDYYESPMKIRSLGRNIIKHSDSMRIL